MSKSDGVEEKYHPRGEMFLKNVSPTITFWVNLGLLSSDEGIYLLILLFVVFS